MCRWRLGVLGAWVALVLCGCPSSGRVSTPEGARDYLSPEVAQPQVDVETRDFESMADVLGDGAVDIDTSTSAAPTLTVQLLWYTPGDPDEADEGLEAGADLDLHLLHPLAAGPDLDGDGSPEGWFYIPWDCFWCNPNPDWGPEGPDGNPYLPVEDIDGSGPETILFTPAEPGLYKIGVHYWDDHGYGPSFATVRVYIWDALAFEFPDVKLEADEVWEVATVEFPSAKISAILDEDGQPKITPPWYSGYLLCPQQ